MNINIGIIVLVIVGIAALVIYINLNREASEDILSKDIKLKLAKMPPISNINNIYQLKALLIEYDKLLDHFLIKKGFRGNTMGERLKDAKNYYDQETYNKIWTAHKFRNVLVHELGADFKENIIKQEIYNLRKAIEISIS